MERPIQQTGNRKVHKSMAKKKRRKREEAVAGVV